MLAQKIICAFFSKLYICVIDLPIFKQNFTLTHYSVFTLNMILTEDVNIICIKQWLLMATAELLVAAQS